MSIDDSGDYDGFYRSPPTARPKRIHKNEFPRQNEIEYDEKIEKVLKNSIRRYYNDDSYGRDGYSGKDRTDFIKIVRRWNKYTTIKAALSFMCVGSVVFLFIVYSLTYNTVGMIVYSLLTPFITTSFFIGITNLRAISKFPLEMQNFFRETFEEFQQLEKEIYIFNKWIKTLPMVYEVASNKGDIIESCERRRHELNHRLNSYCKKLKLSEAMHWTQELYQIGSNSEYRDTKDVACLIALVEANRDQEEEFKSLS